jgi:CHRD domain
MRKVLFLAALVMGLTVAGPAWAAEDVPTPQTFTVELAPSAPSGDPDGSGTAKLTVDLKAKTVCYDITVTGIGVPTEPAAGIGNAHIHSYPESGAIAVDLDTQFAAVGDVEDTYQAKECVTAKRQALVDILLHPEDYYINVHTSDNPGGAVQGDLA